VFTCLHLLGATASTRVTLPGWCAVLMAAMLVWQIRPRWCVLCHFWGSTFVARSGVYVVKDGQLATSALRLTMQLMSCLQPAHETACLTAAAVTIVVMFVVTFAKLGYYCKPLACLGSTACASRQGKCELPEHLFLFARPIDSACCIAALGLMLRYPASKHVTATNNVGHGMQSSLCMRWCWFDVEPNGPGRQTPVVCSACCMVLPAVLVSMCLCYGGGCAFRCEQLPPDAEPVGRTPQAAARVFFCLLKCLLASDNCVVFGVVCGSVVGFCGELASREPRDGCGFAAVCVLRCFLWMRGLRSCSLPCSLVVSVLPVLPMLPVVVVGNEVLVRGASAPHSTARTASSVVCSGLPAVDGGCLRLP
jgi:hypothetical protein